MLESQLILGWMKQGEDRGLVKKARSLLQEVIRTRLQDPVPEDLFLAIEGSNDLNILDQWFKLALRVTNLGELRKAMKNT